MKDVPKVLEGIQKEVNEGNAFSWGKGTGGTYPWSKK